MLGISIYPNEKNVDEIIDYLHLSAKYNVKRIFTNLLEVSESKEVLIERYKKINKVAHEYNMMVIIDVAPSVFDTLDIKYDDLYFFKELDVDGLRLDEGFGGALEAKLTRNEYNLKIEINASNRSPYIEQIIFNNPNLDNLITCHNFYPQKYTALSLEFYRECNKIYKKHNLRIATFITSQDINAHGVWKDSEREPTLEYLRYLPLETQYRHLIAIGETDDIIISNTYATEEELNSLKNISKNEITFKINLEQNLTDIDEKIIFEHEHFVRQDISEYVYRSTLPRITYKDESILPKNTVSKLHRGDVIILNDYYGRYSGELQIVLQDIENDQKRNLIGKIDEDDLILIDFLNENKNFKFIK